jgi:hypothetical protein
MRRYDNENEELKDWSEFNFSDMYGNKMDAYEAIDATNLCAQDNATNCSSSKEVNVSVLSQDTDKFDVVPPPKDHPLIKSGQLLYLSCWTT